MAARDSSESEATVPADTDLVVTAVPTIRWDSPTYTAPAGEITVGLVNEDTIRHDLVVLDGDTKVGDLELIVKAKGDVDSGTITLEPAPTASSASCRAMPVWTASSPSADRHHVENDEGRPVRGGLVVPVDGDQPRKISVQM